MYEEENMNVINNPDPNVSTSEAINNNGSETQFIQEPNNELNTNVVANAIVITNEQPQTQIAEYQQTQDQTIFHSEFAKQMDSVAQSVLVDAAQNDTKFVNTIKENVKDAAVKRTEVEQSKADYAKQQISYESEKLNTLQQKNENQAKEDKWANREKRREYHYNGLKPIMESINIKDPMNLLFLYIIAIIITPIFILGKILKATVGALISGASDGERSKAARGFLWTMLCIIVVLVVVMGIILLLKSQGIDLLAKFKQAYDAGM